MDNTELDRKIEVFDNYIQIPHRTLGILAARFPFLLNIRQEDLIANLKLLVSKQFTRVQIISIVIICIIRVLNFSLDKETC